MRISVAATAPFGADVLERLAARHDVAALLTRPDSQSGRGRKLAAPPAKTVAERLGIDVLQPERPTAELELPGDAVSRRRLRPADPGEPACERALAQRSSVAPAALARRRTGRAGAARGDNETGVTIHETVKELDAGPIAAQRGVPADAGGRRRAVYARAAELAVELLDEVLPEPVVRAAGGRGDLRGEDRARRPRARPLASARA
jgi:methionyl-tRNA formyltransferase